MGPFHLGIDELPAAVDGSQGGFGSGHDASSPTANVAGVGNCYGIGTNNNNNGIGNFLLLPSSFADEAHSATSVQARRPATFHTSTADAALSGCWETPFLVGDSLPRLDGRNYPTLSNSHRLFGAARLPSLQRAIAGLPLPSMGLGSSLASTKDAEFPAAAADPHSWDRSSELAYLENRRPNSYNDAVTTVSLGENSSLIRWPPYASDIELPERRESSLTCEAPGLFLPDAFSEVSGDLGRGRPEKENLFDDIRDARRPKTSHEFKDFMKEYDIREGPFEDHLASLSLASPPFPVKQNSSAAATSIRLPTAPGKSSFSQPSNDGTLWDAICSPKDSRTTSNQAVNLSAFGTSDPSESAAESLSFAFLSHHVANAASHAFSTAPTTVCGSQGAATEDPSVPMSQRPSLSASHKTSLSNSERAAAVAAVMTLNVNGRHQMSEDGLFLEGYGTGALGLQKQQLQQSFSTATPGNGELNVFVVRSAVRGSEEYSAAEAGRLSPETGAKPSSRGTGGNGGGGGTGGNGGGVVTPFNGGPTPVPSQASATEKRGRAAKSRNLPPLNATNLESLVGQGHYFGRVTDIAKNQQGCRALQDRLEKCSEEEVGVVFEEIMMDMPDLMAETFGNYLCQKLMERLSQNQLAELIPVLEPHLFAICTNMHGTRAVQKLIDLATPGILARLSAALAPHVVNLIKDSSGSHVIKRLLSLDTPDSTAMYATIAHHCAELAMDRHGCCVLQKCVELARESDRNLLLNEIARLALSLSSDPYGNYAVQFLVSMDSKGEIQLSDEAAALVHSLRTKVIGILAASVTKLSREKHASNVIEKCLEYGTPQQKAIILNQLLLASPEEMTSVLIDNFGNFVIQTAMNRAEEPELSKLIEKLRPLMNPAIDVATTTIKRALQKLCKKYPMLKVSAAAPTHTSSPTSLSHEGSVANKTKAPERHSPATFSGIPAPELRAANQQGLPLPRTRTKNQRQRRPQGTIRCGASQAQQFQQPQHQQHQQHYPQQEAQQQQHPLAGNTPFSLGFPLRQTVCAFPAGAAEFGADHRASSTSGAVYDGDSRESRPRENGLSSKPREAHVRRYASFNGANESQRAPVARRIETFGADQRSGFCDGDPAAIGVFFGSTNDYVICARQQQSPQKRLPGIVESDLMTSQLGAFQRGRTDQSGSLLDVNNSNLVGRHQAWSAELSSPNVMEEQWTRSMMRRNLGRNATDIGAWDFMAKASQSPMGEFS